MIRNRILFAFAFAGLALAPLCPASGSPTLQINNVGPGGGIPGDYSTITFGSTTVEVYTGEASATLVNGSTSTNFYTFCVDLTDQINTVPTDPFNVTQLPTSSGLSNGNAAAYLYGKYASTSTMITGGTLEGYNLTANDYSAALQLAIWDLVDGVTLKNGVLSGGITIDALNAYNTISLATMQAVVKALVTDALTNGQNTSGSWWQADPPFPPTGAQSFLAAPAPSTFVLAVVALGCVLPVVRYRRSRLLA